MELCQSSLVCLGAEKRKSIFDFWSPRGLQTIKSTVRAVKEKHFWHGHRCKRQNHILLDVARDNKVNLRRDVSRELSGMADPCDDRTVSAGKKKKAICFPHCIPIWLLFLFANQCDRVILTWSCDSWALTWFGKQGCLLCSPSWFCLYGSATYMKNATKYSTVWWFQTFFFFFFFVFIKKKMCFCDFAVWSAANENQVLHHETQLHSVFISYSQFGCVGEGQSSETFPVLEPHSFRHVHKMWRVKGITLLDLRKKDLKKYRWL